MSVSISPAAVRTLSRRIGIPLLVLMIAFAVATAAWLRTPTGSPLADPMIALAAAVLSPTVLGLIVLSSCAIGAAAVAAAMVRPSSSNLLLFVGAGVNVVTFGLLLQGVSTIALAGYLVAFALPAGLAVLVVQVVRRYRRARLPVLLVAAAGIGWGVAVGSLTPDRLAALGAGLAGGFVRSGPRLMFAAAATSAALLWCVTALTVLGGSGRLAGWTAAVVRHRRALTVIAACGPLPYGLIRLTWLTPIPLISPSSQELTPEMRLWGLLLGGGALLGSVLTMGLIRPWGERFPRWMPWLHGQVVPVAVAVVPGGIVAGILTTAAVPMLVMLTFSDGGGALGVDSLADRLLAALVFPFWLWGPALALAVWGYRGHRRADVSPPAAGGSAASPWSG
ncbi:MAG TPA: hypothetical protein VFU98_13860 [Microlunatus sp.]|nr:hypothetical protein [Microlunatus sp.]